MTNAWRGESGETDLPIFGGGRDSVAGFDDPALSDAGVDVADALAFGDGDSYQQERMTAYRLKYGGGFKFESPRDLRRLLLLREWSHEQVDQVFP